jgi:hypothetical protein
MHYRIEVKVLGKWVLFALMPAEEVGVAFDMFSPYRDIRAIPNVPASYKCV